MYGNGNSISKVQWRRKIMSLYKLIAINLIKKISTLWIVIDILV
jgi:hypothetical protein